MCKDDSSTPLRQRSRGRRRARNSGRSSFSSPSPIRPPDRDLECKKLKYASDGETPVSGEVGEGDTSNVEVLLEKSNTDVQLSKEAGQIERSPEHKLESSSN